MKLLARGTAVPAARSLFVNVGVRTLNFRLPFLTMLYAISLISIGAL
ncbi:MAG TPA: hypothetical protein VFG23_23030 [Polyangia bacterium]|nr:hypothetical protein [Polyangia bacterium]